MAITIDDLTVNFSHLDRETLLEDWWWLIGRSKLAGVPPGTPIEPIEISDRQGGQSP